MFVLVRNPILFKLHKQFHLLQLSPEDYGPLEQSISLSKPYPPVFSCSPLHLLPPPPTDTHTPTLFKTSSAPLPSDAAILI